MDNLRMLSNLNALSFMNISGSTSMPQVSTKISETPPFSLSLAILSAGCLLVEMFDLISENLLAHLVATATSSQRKETGPLDVITW